MKLSFHCGSGADLQEAVAGKIEELSGVESSTTIEAGKVVKHSGSGADLEQAIRNRIDALDDTPIASAEDVTQEYCPNCGSADYHDSICGACGFIGGCDDSNLQAPIEAATSEDHAEWDAICDNIVQTLMDQGYWATYEILEDGIVVHVYEDPGKRTEVTTYTREFYEDDFDNIPHGSEFYADRIVESILDTLSGVEACETITASKEDDPTHVERYLHNLIGDLSDQLNMGGITGTIFDNDEENLYITISTAISDATEYQVPLADLTMDFKQMDKDIDYILDGILPKSEDVSSATDLEDVQPYRDADVGDGPFTVMYNGSPIATGLVDYADAEDEAVEQRALVGDGLPIVIMNETTGAIVYADPSTEVVTATIKDPNLDPLYHGYMNRAEAHLKEVAKRYSRGHESPDEILRSLGYVEVEDNLYQNEDAPYTIVIDFNEDNEFGEDDLWVSYFVLKDGRIPRGYCPTKINIYDEMEDPDVTPDVIPTYEMVQSKSVMDSDGFLTDYTWYKDSDGLNVFVFGDNEMYTPENTGFDHVEHDDDAAEEWFDSYTGEDDEDIFSSESAEAAIYARYEVVPAGDFFNHRMMYDVTGELPTAPVDGVRVFVWRGPGKQKDYYIRVNEDRVDHAFNNLTTVMRYLTKHHFAPAVVEAAWGRDWYFGKEQADQFGDLIAEKLSGRTVSKRIALAKEPGGLEYEADQLGIDMWDLLGALEGMCYENRAREIDDSTYKIL